MGHRDPRSPASDSVRLIVAIGLSVSLHALLALAWIVQPPGFPRSDNPIKSQSFVQFGIDQSQHQTIAWLGFIDPTSHQAPLSTTEQSALSPDPSEPQSSISASTASSAIALRFLGAGSAAKTSFGLLIARGQVALFNLLDSASEAAPERDSAQSEPKKPENTDNQPENVDTADPSEETPDADNSANPANASPPAIESPKESDAASRNKVLEYRNGKVASRQGLDIKTKKPEWFDITLLTASPRNPHIRIEFGSDGRVKKAVFEGIGSGDAGVDHSLLNAIYEWTASGREIDQLKESDPKGVVVARVRIILR